MSDRNEETTGREVLRAIAQDLSDRGCEAFAEKDRNNELKGEFTVAVHLPEGYVHPTTGDPITVQRFALHKSGKYSRLVMSRNGGRLDDKSRTGELVTESEAVMRDLQALVHAESFDVLQELVDITIAKRKATPDASGRFRTGAPKVVKTASELLEDLKARNEARKLGTGAAGAAQETVPEGKEAPAQQTNIAPGNNSGQEF